jgi:hypothetical protein
VGVIGLFLRTYKVYLKQLFMVIISCVLLACASSNEAPEDGANESSSSRSDCIFRSSVRGYSVLDESNLVISGAGRQKFHVVLYRRAHGINSSWGISFGTRDSRICAGFGEVVFDNGMSVDSIRIESIRKITPEEHDDLLIQFGKKEPEIQQTPVPNEVKGAEVEELDTAAADDSSGD